MVRYHIDTIPVWDALHAGGECPMCLLRRKTEHMLADRYLGASVMEPDTRLRVNDKGFCPAHHRMLYDRQNRLGHALMMLSHLKEVRARLKSRTPETGSGAKPQGGLFSFKRKAADASSPDTPMGNLAVGCVLCDSLEDNMGRYAYSLLHLWTTDTAIREAFTASKGVCIPDADRLWSMAQEHLSGQPLATFQETLLKLLSDNLARLEEELAWFTLKFDYRNNDKPWGDSRDALERTITKLRGWSVGTDPGRE